MAQLADMTLNDGAEVVFTPGWQDGLKSRLLAADGQSFALTKSIDLLGTKGSATGANRSCTLRVHCPYESESADGRKLTYVGHINISAVIPKTMAVTDVTKLRKLAASLLANEIVVDMIDNGQMPY